MPTNIDRLPLLQVTCETRTNESWSDVFAFVVAGQAAGYPAQGNRGNGAIGPVTAEPGTAVGEHTVRITASDAGGPLFVLSDPADAPLGIGIVGTAFQAGGLSFTIAPGTATFAVGDAFTIVVLGEPLDLTGIGFAIMTRAGALDANVTLQADTAGGALIGGGANGAIVLDGPNGLVGLAFSPDTMRGVPAATYEFDVLAIADNTQRRCIAGAQVHAAGVTHRAA